MRSTTESTTESTEVVKERPIVKEKMTSEEVLEVIRVNEEEARKKLEELNNLDLSSLEPTA